MSAQKTTTEQLIATLAADLGPNRRLAAASVRTSVWLGLALVLVAATVVTAGRFGLAPKIEATFASCISLLVLASTMVVGALAAFREAVPGSDTRSLRLAVCGVILPLWVLVELAAFFLEPAVPTHLMAQLSGGHHCTVLILAFSFVPMVAVYYMLSRGAATHPARCGALALLAAAATGALGMQILCPAQEAAHLLAWHIVPTVGMGALGYLLGRLLLRW